MQYILPPIKHVGYYLQKQKCLKKWFKENGSNSNHASSYQWAVKVTSLSGLSLLPVWAGRRSHFSLLSRASRTPEVISNMFIRFLNNNTIKKMENLGHSETSSIYLAFIQAGLCPCLDATAEYSFSMRRPQHYFLELILLGYPECRANE